MKTLAKKSKTVGIKNTSNSEEVKGPPSVSTSVFKRIGTWSGWIILYLCVFYLGNLSGEFVAAKMPLSAWRLPELSLNTGRFTQWMPKSVGSFFHMPDISIQVNPEKLQMKNFSKISNNEQVNAHTKTIIISGETLTIPLSTASDSEKSQFYSRIDSLSKETSNVSLSASCEMNPAFIRVVKGSTLTFTTLSQSEQKITINTKEYTISSSMPLQSTVEDTAGLYSVTCSGSLSGYLIVK